MSLDLPPGVVHGAGEVAPGHRELHTDITRIVLAVDEGGAVLHADVGEFFQRDLRAVRRGNEEVADSLRVVAELLFQAHHEVELLFALHHLRRGSPADGRLNQAVDVGDVQAVTGDLGAVNVHGQARLAEFPDQRDLFDPAHTFQHALDCLAFGFQRLEVRPEDLDRQRAFQAGFGFIHGVFGGLRVVENDAGKRLELLVNGLDQLRLRAIRPFPFAVWL